jgi:cell division protein FtsN
MVQEIILETALPIVLGFVVTTLGGFLIAAAKKAADWMTLKASETKNALLKNVLTLVADQASIAVQHTAQTLVDQLKARSANGKLTPEQAQQAMQEAVIIVWRQLGEQGRELLRSEFGSFEAVANTVLKPAVEARVHEMKPAPVPVVLDPASEKMARELEMFKANLVMRGSR